MNLTENAKSKKALVSITALGISVLLLTSSVLSMAVLPQLQNAYAASSVDLLQDDFDDGSIATNTASGVGTGWVANSIFPAGASTATESGSEVTITGSAIVRGIRSNDAINPTGTTMTWVINEIPTGIGTDGGINGVSVGWVGSSGGPCCTPSISLELRGDRVVFDVMPTSSFNSQGRYVIITAPSSAASSIYPGTFSGPVTASVYVNATAWKIDITGTGVDVHKSGTYNGGYGLNDLLSAVNEGDTLRAQASTFRGNVPAKFDSVLVTKQIQNSLPALGPISAPIEPLTVGAAISASASFTDADVSDTHTAVWSWGDGSTSTGTIAESGGSGSVTGSQIYTTPGVYAVTLTLTDNDGGSATEQFQYIVIYDPNGGFVTGGGWINSPAGAYGADASYTGKASFGFVAKYLKGATTPSGNTEFQFKVADFNFKSSSYDWLVVSGAKAQYKGTGTINGAGEYSFILTAIDADVNTSDPHTIDKFRIKIWDKATSAVVYDNQMNAADNAEPTTAIAGGSIKIHKQ